MEKVILKATKRQKSSRRFNEAGFVPGVIYGDSVDTISVKFEESELRRIIASHGSNAKVWINLDSGEKFGFIKEIQRTPLTAQLRHVDIQVVRADEEIKLNIPITYVGEGELGVKQYRLQPYKNEVSVQGIMTIMPNVLEVDVSNKELGDTITAEDFKLDERIKVLDREDEVYGAVTHLKTIEKDTEEEVDAAEETAEETKEDGAAQEE